MYTVGTVGIYFFLNNFTNIFYIGAAILAREKLEREKKKTMFKGFSVSDAEFKSRSFICSGCPNRCEVVCVLENQKAIGYFGDRCGKYNNSYFSSPAVYV
jgi:hypothetical protein